MSSDTLSAEAPKAKEMDGSKFILMLVQSEKPPGDFAERVEKTIDDLASKREKPRRIEREGRTRFVSKVSSIALCDDATCGPNDDGQGKERLQKPSAWPAEEPKVEARTAAPGSSSVG